MQQPSLYLAPFAFLVPVVVAIVKRIRSWRPNMASPLVTLTSLSVGVVLALTFFYFGAMPEWLKVVVAGSAVGLGASGTVDLFSLFGTTTTNVTHIVSPAPAKPDVGASIETPAPEESAPAIAHPVLPTATADRIVR